MSKKQRREKEFIFYPRFHIYRSRYKNHDTAKEQPAQKPPVLEPTIENKGVVMNKKQIMVCQSPTGVTHCVKEFIFHPVEDNDIRTLCNHKISFYNWHSNWPLVNKPVTCKRCLKSMEKMNCFEYHD